MHMIKKAVSFAALVAILAGGGLWFWDFLGDAPASIDALIGELRGSAKINAIAGVSVLVAMLVLAVIRAGKL